MFAGAPCIEEGFIHNLSETGCLIECDHSVLNGSYITVRLLLPDHARALVIDLAAIRWVREQYFGIEFLRLPPSDHSRLDQFLSAHRRTYACSDRGPIGTHHTHLSMPTK